MEVEIPLRWSDMDAQRHVNNARIADHLQEARAALLADTGLLGSGIVVTRQQVQFRRSVDYDTTPLAAEVVVTGLGGARIEIGTRLRQAGEVAVEARTQLTGFDFAEQRPTRLSDDARAVLEGHREDWAAFDALEAPALEGRGTRTLHHPRFSDVDRYGHVGNVLAFEYLQQARVEVSPVWDPSLARTGSDEAEHLWLVVRQDVEYVAQMRHTGRPFAVHTAPVHLGRSSLTSAAEITSPDGELLARGRTVVVCAGRDFKPTAIPCRERLEQFLVA